MDTNTNSNTTNNKLDTSLLNWLFLELNRILVLGSDESSQLQVNDLIDLPEELHPLQTSAPLKNNTSRVSKTSKVTAYTLLSSLFKLHLTTIVKIGIIKLITVLLSFSGSLLIGATVAYISDDNGNGGSVRDGIILILLFIIAFTITAIMNTILGFQTTLLVSKLKVSVEVLLLLLLLLFR